MSCPKGKIYRKPYTRQVGATTVRVPGNCITATSQSGLKRSELDKAKIASRKKSQKKAAAATHGPTRCPTGMVKREAYPRKAYTRAAYTRADGTRVAAARVERTNVPSTCIAATGKAKVTGKKGKQLFILEEGVLGKYGYDDVKRMAVAARHAALNKALADGIKPLPLFRRLNALYVLNENKDKEAAAIFRADRDYIKTTRAWARAHSPSRGR